MSVFISYTTQYRSQVDQAARHLTARGYEPFLDWLTISPGEIWSEKLEIALINCSMALVFLGKETGPWQKREIYYLLDRSARGRASIIPILIENAEPPIGLLGLHQWLDWRPGIGPDQLRQLDVALEGFNSPFPPNDSVAHKLNVSPYRGERAYREVDGNLGPSHKMFGARDEDIMHIANLIRNPHEGVIQVEGEPGVGKTSLIYAGVMPELQRPQSHIADYRYTVAHVHIDRDPFHDLAGALARVDMSLSSAQAVDRAGLALQIEEGLRNSRRFLETYLSQLVQNDNASLSNEKALIVIHGADRLWDCERSLLRKFEKVIRNAAESSSVTLLFSTTRKLPFGVDQKASLKAITKFGYEEVIRKPARMAGIYVDDTVVERVASEAQSIGSVQRMLSRIWTERTSAALDAETLRKAFE